METIWKKKIATVIGSMIPSGIIVKTKSGDEKVIELQILKNSSDEFDANVITENSENHSVYKLEDVKPYLRTYFQLTESEKTHLGYLDDDYEKSEISIALAYMLCVTDRDGQNELIENDYALKAPKGMYKPMDWPSYNRELYGEDYDDDDEDDDDINFSNDDLDDDEDYDEK